MLDKEMIESAHQDGVAYSKKEVKDASAEDFDRKLKEVDGTYANIIFRIKEQDRQQLDNYCL